MRFVCFVLLIVFNPFGSWVNAQNSSARQNWYGVYSDVRYSERSGDLVGTEIFILPGPGKVFMLYQEMAGEPMIPVLVEAQINGDAMTANVPFGSKVVPLHAKLMRGDLIFSLETNPSEETRLKKGRSYLQKYRK